MNNFWLRSVVILGIFFLSTAVIFGQARGGQGIVVGKVVDEQTNQGLEFATISIFAQADSSLVGGDVSDKKGQFTARELPFGAYFVEINFMGYEPTVVKDVNITRENNLVDLETILLVLAAENLEEVTVTGRADYVINKIDRKAYNISKLAVASGGTADEVLQLIPSVEVDIDGNISLRGSENVTVLIDGNLPEFPVTTLLPTWSLYRPIPLKPLKSLQILPPNMILTVWWEF
jgi:hypothetical protein